MRRFCLTGLVAVGFLCAGAASGTVAASGTAVGLPKIAAGGLNTCVVLADGTARCWGDNSTGQLGDGTLTSSRVPVTVENVAGTGPLTGIANIAVGGRQACALMRDGTAQCWGSSASGDLGFGDPGQVNCPPLSGLPSCRTLPVIVENPAGTGPLTDIAYLTIGDDEVCAVLIDSSALCWGANDVGQLGIGNNYGPDDCYTGRLFSCSWRPIAISNPVGTGPLTGVTGIAAYSGVTCARLANSRVECWGDDELGQLGIGTATGPQVCDVGGPLVACSTRPVAVRNHTNSGPFAGAVEIAAGSGATLTCARMSNRTVQCWGSLPTVIKNHVGNAALQHVAAIATGYQHSCALLTYGTIQCWGANNDGQLGNGTRAYSARPTAVTGIVHAVAVAAGSQHSCAVSTDGSVKCWGDNTFGQLGIGTPTRSTTPITVKGLNAPSIP